MFLHDYIGGSDGGADRVRISMLQGGTSTVAPRWPDVHPFFHPLVTSFQGKILTEKYQKRREGGCRSTTFFTSMCREKTKCPARPLLVLFFLRGGGGRGGVAVNGFVP